MKKFRNTLFFLISSLLMFSFFRLPLISQRIDSPLWISAVNFPVFLFYWLLLITFAFFHKKILMQKIENIIIFLIFAGFLVPLVHYLSDFRINFIRVNPFPEANIYNYYAELYFLLLFALAAFITGKIFFSIVTEVKDYFLVGNLDDKVGRTIFYSPVFLLIIFSEVKFFIFGDYLIFFTILFTFLFSGLIYNWVILLINKFKTDFGFMKNDYFLPLFLFIFSFLIRYLWGERLLFITQGRFLLASDDGEAYSKLAALIVRGEKIPSIDALYRPGMGYWYFLSLIYRFFGMANYKAVIIIQSLAGALVPVTIFYTTKWLFNKPIAVIAAILCALALNLIFLSVVVGMEALFIPFLLATMVLFIKFVLDGKIKKNFYARLSGFLFSLVYLARQETMLIFIVIPICMLIFLRNQIPTKKIVKILLNFALGAAIPLFFLASYNYNNYGAFTILNRGILDTFDKGHGSIESTLLAQMGFDPFKTLSGSLKTFVNEPMKVIQLLFLSLFKKGNRYLFYPNFGLFDAFIITNPIKYFSRYGIYFSCCSWFLFFWGIISSLKEKKKRFVVSLIIGYCSATFALYAILLATNARHRGVAEPFFLMFVAIGIYHLLKERNIFSPKIQEN